MYPTGSATEIQTGTWRAACVPKAMFAALSHLAPRQGVLCTAFYQLFFIPATFTVAVQSPTFAVGLVLFSSALLRYCFGLRKDAL